MCPHALFSQAESHLVMARTLQMNSTVVEPHLFAWMSIYRLSSDYCIVVSIRVMKQTV